MTSPAQERNGPDWRRRAIIGGSGAVGVLILYFSAAAIVPRWWAQRVADVVDGSLTTGALFGLFIGFTFTVVPIAVGAAAVKWRSTKRRWVGWLVWSGVVLVCALPNIMTGAIVFGRSDAAHAGDRILDVDGPGFRLWSLVGIIVGAALAAAIGWVLRSRRVAKEQVRAATTE